VQTCLPGVTRPAFVEKNDSEVFAVFFAFDTFPKLGRQHDQWRHRVGECHRGDDGYVARDSLLEHHAGVGFGGALALKFFGRGLIRYFVGDAAILLQPTAEVFGSGILDRNPICPIPLPGREGAGIEGRRWAAGGLNRSPSELTKCDDGDKPRDQTSFLERRCVHECDFVIRAGRYLCLIMQMLPAHLLVPFVSAQGTLNSRVPLADFNISI
jgi:hypothetical protein